MSSFLRRILLVTCAGQLACESMLPQALYNQDGGFFDAPFPSLARSNEDGTPNWSDFPNPTSAPLLDLYLDETAELKGASTVGPVFFRFSGGLATRKLPTEEESTSTDSPLWLLGVDPTSPDRGEWLPLRWDWQHSSTTYQERNLLAVAPADGVPLRPDTTYAVVITTDLAQRPPAFDTALSPDGDRPDAYALLKDTLLEEGVSLEKVAVASVFHTQDPVSEMAEWAWWVRHNLPSLSWDATLSPSHENESYRAYAGSLWMPLFQHGEKPYTSEGGGFAREDGNPAISEWERVPFVLSVPLDPPPEAGWPVVIWSHGTGGDETNCCNGDGQLEAARVLAEGGLAVLSTPQPLHGARATAGTLPELHSFNPMNPTAARTNFRQGALEIVYLAKTLSARQQSFLLDGVPHALDPSRVMVMGHSHGGLTGAIAAPFLGGLAQAVVLSAAGGGMSTTLTLRTEPINLEGLMREAFSFQGDEEVDALHPICALVQAVTDVTDPLNFARYWHREADWFSEAPVNLLLTSGLEDALTPPETGLALAAAGGLPILAPVSWHSPAHDNADLSPASLPATGNLLAWDGSRTTGGVAQFPENGHYAVFHNLAAAQLYRHYLETAAAGAPVLQETTGASK